MMKATFLAAAALAAAAATAGQDNLLVRFSTPGPDSYADGTTVRDGESYSLVWVKSGETFAGFLADGTVADPETSAVICTVPYAQGGRCPVTILEMDRALADAYAGAGSFELHVLDTRAADGEPKGVEKSGVNASGRAAEMRVTAGAGTVAAQKEMGAKTATLAATATALPASIPTPKITSIKVENGRVRLTVKGTSRLVRYGVRSGETPADLTATAATADGDDFGEIEILLPAEKGGRFFSVGRAPLK